MLRAKQTPKFFSLILSMAIVIGFTTFTVAASQVTDKDMGEMPAPASFSDVTIQSTSDSSILLAKNESAMDDQEEMLALLAVLEEETEVATKTKMNADYVPGIVTVLHGEDLEAMGARTVWEALAFVPGVEINQGATGFAVGNAFSPAFQSKDDLDEVFS